MSCEGVWMSNDSKNPFGGGNPNGLYVPLSEDEQEVLLRLVETRDLVLTIHAGVQKRAGEPSLFFLGNIESPQCIVGDLRVAVPIHLRFNSPAAPVPLLFLDLELRTQAGYLLFKKREPIVPPPQVSAGVEMEFQWDIALHHMDPALVRALKPGAMGLTSRRQNRDSQEFTPEGNMKLDLPQKRLLRLLEGGEAKNRKSDFQKVVKATEEAGQEIKKTGDGLVIADHKRR